MDITKNIIDNMSNYDVSYDNENYESEYKIMIIFCNINKINNSWKKSLLYITSNISELENKDKYIQSKKDLLSMKVEKPPFIYLTDDNNIEFIDGRHRFANLRDMNCKKMPFIIYKTEYEIISNLYC